MYIRKYDFVREKSATYNAQFIDRKIASTDDVARVLTELVNVNKYSTEHFFVFTLNTKMKITGIHDISRGTIDAAPVHPREVFIPAINTPDTAAVIVAHNHPSGDPTASRQDLEVTQRLAEAGEILGVKLLDHIVAAGSGFVSIKGAFPGMFKN